MIWALGGAAVLVVSLVVAAAATHYPDCGCARAKPLAFWCRLGWHIWEPIYRDVVEFRCAACGQRPAHDEVL